jgi:hypothetical protein
MFGLLYFFSFCLSSIIRALDCVVVDRLRGDATAVFDALRERARGHGGRRRQVLVFPEGTTVNQTSVITFKRGVFVPGASVQPVACRIPWHRVDPAWVNDGPSQYTVLLRQMAQPVNHVRMETGNINLFGKKNFA